MRRLVWLALACGSLVAQDLDQLLGAYAQEADLSLQTKKESGGFLQVYTRQDLDRMQIRQLKEIIEKIPFFRYREDNFGLSNPFYSAYQPTPPSGLRVYINDRALTNAYTNDGLRLLGQMDLGFIDHIEVYLGIPSQTFGIEGAACVIKLYTKDPRRENTTLVGAILGSRGTQEYYGYDAHVRGDLGYLAYANYTNLQRQNVYAPNGMTFRRDKEYLNAYGEVRRGYHRFEIQAVHADVDAFIGDSWRMDSVDPALQSDYIYLGWYYDNPDSGWKAFLNFSDTASRYTNRSVQSVLGILPIAEPPYYRFYREEIFKLDERLSDLQVRKCLSFGALSNETGIQARYKSFDPYEVIYDGIRVPASKPFDTQMIYSVFDEATYLFNPSHMVVGSFKIDRYDNNGPVRDETLLSGRVGYIYNSSRWTWKSFLMYSDYSPDMQTLYRNRYVFRQNDDPGTEHALLGATRLIYKTKGASYSFLASRTRLANAVYFTFDPVTRSGRYGNLEQAMLFDSFLAEYTRHFTPLTKLKINAWEVISRYNNYHDSSKTYGGVASLTTTVDAWDLHTDLVYKYYNSVGSGLDWNAAVTYHASRKLSLFLKGNNILGRALTQNYYTYDPLHGEITTLPDVDIFDKRLWVGLEYQF